MKINTNFSAQLAARSAVQNERASTAAMERLSTGIRINSATDDPAGWTISSKMTSNLMGMQQALRNTYDGVSMLETAAGAATEMGNMVQRVRELTLQGISDSSTVEQKAMMQNEANELIAEMENIALDTQFNNKNLLDGSGASLQIQIGSVAGQTFDVSIGSLTNSELQLTGLDIIARPAEALQKTDAAVLAITGAQAKFGVDVALLNQAIDGLVTNSQSFQAARGRIIDADYAVDTTVLASKTIMGEAAIAMVSQANQRPKAVHHLLQVESSKRI
ncbi:flagellin [Porticoccaceae bacterium]|nr:flagellin [Porticoccaceae bacterium]